MSKKITPQAKVINLFFVLLAGFVVANGIAVAIVQEKLPAVGQAVQMPFDPIQNMVTPAPPVIENSRCVDSDNGADAKMPGSATYYTGELEGETRYDLCADDTQLVERACIHSKLQTQKIDCAALGLHCIEDADLRGYCG